MSVEIPIKPALTSSDASSVAPGAGTSGIGRPGWLDLALCAGAGLALGLLWQVSGGWVFPLDDAYITLHNAQVLQESADPNYGVSALIGATSLIHLALVTLATLALPPELGSYVVASVATVLFLAGLRRLAQTEKLPTLEGGLFTIIGMASAAPQLLNGLETGLAMAAVLWALLLATRSPPSQWLAVLAGLLPFLRPELGLLSLLLMVRQSWLRLSATSDRRAAVRSIAIDAMLASAAAAPWLAWSLVETGMLLPNTLGAKQAFFAAAPHALPVAIGITAAAAIGAAGPCLAGLVMLRGDPLTTLLWAFVILFVLGFALTMPEAMGQNGNRYAYLLLPVLLFALGRIAGSRGLAMLRLLLAAQAAFCALLLSGLPATLTATREHMADHMRVADWAQANLPPNARVLIHDAGVIALRTNLPLIDLVGLKSPASTAEHRHHTLPSLGQHRDRAVDAIARRVSATHALAHEHPESGWISLVAGLRRQGWRAQLLFGDRQPVGFRLFRLTPPDSPAI